jgi:thiol-disulfide isomerase/thioredoxin
MKLINLSLFFTLFAFSHQIFAGGGDKITITCNITNCQGDSLNLYQFDGIVFSKVQTAKSAANAHIYKFTLPKGKNDFYFLGQSVQELKPLILGTEENISLEGNCYVYRELVIKGSKMNKEYDIAMKRLAVLLGEADDAKKAWDFSINDPQKHQIAETEMANIDRKKMMLLDSLRKSNPYLARLVGMNTIYSYPVNGAKKYPEEIKYIANEYFANVDFKEDDYNRLPMVFEGFKNFTNILNQYPSLTPEIHRQYIENWLNKFSKNSRAYKMGLGGVVTSLMSRNHINYIYFGELYCKMYEKEEPSVTSQLQQLINRSKTSIPGVEMPDFTQNNTENQPISLKSLRGKVVLIDFWASWCGPCRRENPNVVATYNKYKDKGFDILSVSLDSDRDRWLGAIEADGLIWKNHVSDLKGWQNQVAGQYAVSSIPQTLLIDREGKLIARNLRGEQLGEALKQLLGE